MCNHQVIKLTTNDPEPILLNLYKGSSHSDHAIVFVGGDEDDRSMFENIVVDLKKNGIKCDVVTISFRGVETGRPRPVVKQVKQLEEIYEYLINQKNKSTFDIICTSAGAFSVTNLLVNREYGSSIRNAIYLDPADYYLKKNKYELWVGFETYIPEQSLVANQLNSLKTHVKVHVISFTIRNHGPNGYSDNRGEDDPNYFKRLNYDMVKAFYDQTPKSNQGKYLEVNSLPHAFVRDGDIKTNEKKIIEIVSSILLKY